jgi:hypothetical protein
MVKTKERRLYEAAKWGAIERELPASQEKAGLS